MDMVPESSKQARARQAREEDNFPEFNPDYLREGESEHDYTEGDEELFSDMPPVQEFSGLGSPMLVCTADATMVEEDEATSVGVIPSVDKPSVITFPGKDKPGMSRDKSETPKSYSLAVISAQMRACTIRPRPLSPGLKERIEEAERNLHLTDAWMNAEILKQDMEVRKVCVASNLEWVYLAQELMPWAGSQACMDILMEQCDVLLQPRIFRSSPQYAKAMELLRCEILKAKKLLLEREIELNDGERIHLEKAGMQRQVMASHASLVKYVENILEGDGTPLLISDINGEECRTATVREIGTARKAGSMPKCYGKPYPLPPFQLDYNSSSIAFLQKDSWAKVVSRRGHSRVVHNVKIPNYTRAERVYDKDPESVMCLAAVGEDFDDDDDVQEGEAVDVNPEQAAVAAQAVEAQVTTGGETRAVVEAAELARAEAQIAAEVKKAKAAATRKSNKEKAEAARAKKAAASTRRTRGSALVTPPEVERVVPVTTATPLTYDEDLAQFADSIRRGVGTVFRDDYAGSAGASTSRRASMGPPPLPSAAQTLMLQRTMTNQPAVSLASLETRALPQVGTPVTVPNTNPATLSSANIPNVAQQIRERFEAQYPGSRIPVTRIMQSMLPEGYSIVNTNPMLPQVPTGCDGADDPPPRPENLTPREADEDEANYNARVDAWSRIHGIYLQQLKGYELRLRTRQMVRTEVSGSDKNIRKISDCTKDTPVADWLRATRLNLIARNVHDEAEQVKQASSYLYSVLQRRWIIAKDKSLLEGKPISWRMFSNHLLTGVDGVQPAEAALRALQNYTVQAGKSPSANLYQFQKLLDTCADCLPGTRFQMPSGYELCALFIDRVVKFLPKDISNSLIDAHVARVTAQEETEFFLGDQIVINDWYRDLMHSLLLQGIAKANALPKDSAGGSGHSDKQAARGNGGNGKGNLPPGFAPNGKNGVNKKSSNKRTKPQAGTSEKKPKSLKYSDFMEHLKKEGKVDTKLLFTERGRCTFCGKNNHLGKDCTVNLNKHFKDDPIRATNSLLARDMASKFFG